MYWKRRRDLEGGKELGIWLLCTEDGDVDTELYVESHEYRGGAFDVFTYSDGDGWVHKGTFDSASEAFDHAADVLAESEYPIRDSLERGDSSDQTL